MVNTTHVTPEEYHTMKMIKENYLALYTNLSNPHVAVGQRDPQRHLDDEDEDLPEHHETLAYRAAVLGEDKRKSSPDDFEILSLTKLGRTRLDALRSLLAHLEDRTAEGIDRVEENTRKKEAAAAAKENRGKATEKKGVVRTGGVTEAASKTAMTKRTATRSVLSRTKESKQAPRSKGTRTEKVAEDRDATESMHSDEEAMEVGALGRGKNAAPKRTVPKSKKSKQTQIDDNDDEEVEEEEDEDYDNHQPSKKLKSGNREARQNLKATGITHEDDAETHAAEPRKPRYKPLNRQTLLRKQKKEAREAMQREKQDE